MVGIIDYGVGNIGSLQHAFEKQGIETLVSRDIEVLGQCEALLLPGVGAFRDGIEHIERYGLRPLIERFAQEGKVVIGICLGMQLFYEEGRENGCYKGLGLLKGKIEKIKAKRLPHMGWNELYPKKEDALLKAIEKDAHVYFVHSYRACGNDEQMVAYTTYTELIPAIVRQGNIIGFQFHPEKSGAVGEQLIRNLKEVIQCTSIQQ